MSKKKHELTDKERTFVREYLVDLSATKAAERAKYSKKSARQIGSELLAKPEIAAAIKLAMDERGKRTEVTADRVIKELAKVAFVNMKDLADWKGGKPVLRDSDDMEDDDAAALKGFTYSESSSSGQTDSDSCSYSFTTHDKVKALELLGKHHKLFVDRVEHDISDGLADRLMAARERAKKAKGKKA